MEPFALIIFGITSNLSQIKLIPALYDMEEKGFLPKDMSIIGNARKPMSREEIQKFVFEVLQKENKHHKHEIKEDMFKRLSQRFYYIDGHLDDPDFYPRLKDFLKKKTKMGTPCNNLIFYLATYPELYHHIFKNLHSVGLNIEKNGFVRLMIEKPIGHDLKSAKELNSLLHKYFKEDQIYRLDHYLGKDTLQNILTFRFGNGVFEPVINKDFVDHIQITATEDFGIGGRGGYYDQVGALKDVGQNHQLQMLAFTTMDAPHEFSNNAVTRRRIEILKHLKPLPDKIVFGQYQGYKKEPNVDPHSNIETFYAYKTYIENERFKNVPIYVRAGKKLNQTVTEISIVFKNPVNRLFNDMKIGNEPNVLIYRIQPNEGIVLKMLVKKPGPGFELEPNYMQYCYKLDPKTELPDPYEKLLLDAISGNQTFFNDAEEVEAQWAFIDPLSEAKKKVTEYEPGSWGPKEADELIKADGRQWLEPSMLFCRI
ncbi:glucose-6-phosphate dehydrogenase [Candidatus Daviesbacteria bacterium]|nr:glucose-6-phosphate dehydrogenase [Candidatus Daviesbacteria bacterium]